jgi:MtrB/PioB family decaheme-associated outer membrane protein
MIMKSSKQKLVFRKKILALSVLMAIGVAHADEDEDVVKLTKNESSVSVGAGNITGYSADRSIFTQYNGMRNNDVNILLDINVLKLNDEKGLWTKIEGHNLLLDDREFIYSQNKQGDWKYSLEYNEITHHEIRTINTGLRGAGSLSPTIVSLSAPGAGSNLNLQLQRQSETLGVEKWITPSLLFETTFKNEDKTGARLSGEGITCTNGSPLSRFACGGTASLGGAVLMLPEPVSTNTKQIEAKLNYSGEKFLVSGGYYGAFFTDNYGSMNPNLTDPSNAANPNFNSHATNLLGYLSSPIALQPNSQSQQLYVSGNYAFTPTTHSTFKYAYTHATQNESFSNMGLTGAPNGVSSLGGEVDTNLAQFGLTARPMPKLTLLANVRYEDKNDKTPTASYNVLSSPLTTAPTYSNNYSSSSTKVNGKIEAAYQLPDHYRATFGVDYATVQRAAPPTSSGAATDLGLALGGMRANTREVGYRAELRRSFTDTFNTAIIYVHSQRSGDDWTFYGNGHTSTQPINVNGTLPMTMMDRNRDKVRWTADWSPISKLSFQFNAEEGKDTYTGPIETGMRDTNMSSLGVDAVFILSESWKLTGYLSKSDQTLHVNHTAQYLAELTDVNTSVGFGVIGKPTSKIDVGGNISYMNDSNRYDQTGGGLPDVNYEVTSLKLFGKYSLQKNSDFRVDLVHQASTLNEWSWGSNGQAFAYTDNTTVTLQPHQCVTFLGGSYVYKFR